MMHLVLAVAATAALATSGSSESQRFAAFLDSVYQANLASSPQEATQAGLRLGYDRWDDTSEAALATRAGRIRENIRAAKTRFVLAKLDPAGQLQYRVFLDEQQLLLDRYRWRDHFYALNQIVGLHLDIPDTLTGAQPLDNEADAEAYIRRISAARMALHQLVQRMRSQAAHGLFMPKPVYPLLIEGARNVITGAPHDGGSDSQIYADFKRRVAKLGISEDRKTQLMLAARTALLDDLQPGYEELLSVLKEQEARTPVTAGVWQTPDGDAFYQFLVRQFTTTRMTPADIHALGLQQVEAVHAQIAAVMRTLGFEGSSVREFMAKTKADPRFYLSNDDAGRQEFLERARQITTTMQAHIPEAFEAAAPLPLEVRRAESYKEASAPGGFYDPGTNDGRRPGIVYLNLYDMHQQPLYELEDLLYHEGVPGHHMQMSTIQTDEHIPRMRKVNEWWQDTAFVEGWGLYAERLGKDMGFYQDPYADLGRLTGELWRACRLVVDSGLHYRHWTRAEAIRYLQENSAAPDGTIVREVDRYIAVPGQATAFTVGMLKFVAERERARKALGPRFDIREYHHVVLQNGYLPLWALEDWVSRWIESKQVTAASPPTFSGLLGAYWADWLRLNPALALTVGDYSTEELFDESLEDSWRARVLERLKHYASALAGTDLASLRPDDQVSYSILRYRLDQDLRFYGSHLFEVARMLPIDQFQGLHIGYAAEAAGSGSFPYKTVADYDKALVRADNYARWTDDVIQRLREGVAAGVVLPRIVVERMLPQLHGHLGIPPEKTQFWHPVEAFPSDVGAEDRARLTAAYRVKIATVIQPAYQRLYDYLSSEYFPHARPTDGLGQMPGGRELYSYYVRYHTTTDLTPAQIHALGVSEVQRITAQLAAVQESVHFKGTLHEFLTHVRDDPSRHFSRPEEVVPAFEAARQQIMPKLPGLFDVLPKAPYEIRALPESSRNSLDNGYFAPAAPDGSRPGILWVNIYASGVRDKFNVMTISLHEGLPGHHLQTSVAQERTDLPSFRRFDSTNAYVEGWGLYAETLGQQMGFYAVDPWQLYGHLNYAMLRANRLVVDTGIHAEGWPVAQAVHWMTDHSSMSEAQATAEVERYVAYPGQALSYKIGEQKILELRERARRKLGTRFDIRAFHDQILLGGSMPLAILEQKVDRWLASASASSSEKIR
jgi:uncharacterized protein (DUF885 family)